jgi:DHA2 family multidrug resistance protein-like MFS transporter
MEAALWSLLPTVLVGVAAPLAAVLVERGVNRAYVVSAGFVIAAFGFGMLTATGTDSLWLVLGGAGLIASGIVTVMSQMMDLALGAVPPEKAGTASSVLETGAEFGGALGMAILGSIGTAVYRHDIPDTAPAEAHETLGAALAVARHLPDRAGDALVTTAREAFTSGMQAAAIAGTALLLGAAVLAALTLRRVRVRETESVEPEEARV